MVSFTLSIGKGAQGATLVKRLEGALKPEAGRALPGAVVKLARKDGGRALEVRIEATNLRALRAATNSYLRWTTLAAEVVEKAAAHNEDE